MIYIQSTKTAINFSSEFLKYLKVCTVFIKPRWVPYNDLPFYKSQTIIVFLYLYYFTLSSIPPRLDKYNSLFENVKLSIITLCNFNL